MPPLEFKRVLFINPFGIGDVLFTTPLIRALKKQYPDCFVGYWCNERVKGILENNRHIDKIFALSKGDIKKAYKLFWPGGLGKTLNLLKRIRREHFDIAFDLSLDSYYGLMSALSGIRERVGYDYKKRGRFLTKKLPLSGYSGKHVIEYGAELLGSLGIPVVDKNMELMLCADDESKAEMILFSSGILPGDLLIGIAPGAGASWGKDASYKQWPALKFAEVADRLISEYGAKVVLLGDDTDLKLSEEISNACKNKPINLVGKTTLPVLAGILKRLKLFVSNDGGPMHMAVALGINTVSIFGPVDDKVYGPYPPDKRNLVVKATVECRPCYSNFVYPSCVRNRDCLTSIRTEEVFKNIKQILNLGDSQ